MLVFPEADVGVLLWGLGLPLQFAEARQIAVWGASYLATLVPHPKRSIPSGRILRETGAAASVEPFAS